MRIVIAGAGEVGSHLAKMLSRENHEIVIIDKYENRLKDLLETSDLMTLTGSVTSKRLLIEAGTGDADIFIAVTPWDDTNIVSAILAKKLGARLTVVRISSSEPMNRENREIANDVGIDSFVYPEKVAAAEVINTLRQSGVSMLIEFSEGKLSLLAVKMNKNAPFLNKSLAETGNNMDYRAVAVQRNGKTIIPHGDVTFEPDDIVYIVANRAGIKNILQYSGHDREQMHQVMILGGSHIGRLIAKELGKGYHIKIFEADSDAAYQLSDRLNNALVINGDGTKIDLLLEEGLRKTDAFIAVTGNSETNILTCLLAKNEGVRHTVAEIENLDYINIAERLGIDVIINKKLIAANHIYRFTLSDNVAMFKHLATTGAEALEFVVPQGSKITAKPLCEINFPAEAIIGGLVRGKTGYIATGDITIQPDDHVVVFAMPTAINDVSKLFK